MRYLDLEGLSLTNPTEQYAGACGAEWDEVGVPVERLRAGDTVVTGPWGAWEWLPEYIDVELVPDGNDGLRRREANPLVHALRVRGLPPALARKAPTPRARTYAAYADAVAWVAETASRLPRANTSNVLVGGAPPAPHRVLHTLPDVLHLYRELRDRPFAWDLETTGLDPRTDTVVGCAVAHEDMAYWVPEGLFHHSAPAFVDLLHNVPHAYGSNLKFDMGMLAMQYGLVPSQCMPWDTQVMHFVLDPGAFQHGLKYLAKHELGRDPLEFKDVTAAYTNFRQVPAELAARYAAAGDARNSYDLVVRFREQLRARGLLDVYTNLEQPVTPVLCEMELAGLALDRRRLFQIASDFADAGERIKHELKELGFDGNPNADAQVARFLYEQLGLPALVTTAKTGRGSVALPVLRKLLLLRGSHEGVARWARAVELFMEWSDVDKNLGTFLVPWLVSHVRTVYAELKQTRVVTGRLASEPNIQNWPARVRAMVVAPQEGWLCSADYAQGEPRLAAHYSQDERMLDDFRSGRDVYVSLGVDMGFALADLGKHSQLRQNIKTTFLAWQYMTSPPKIQEIALRQGTVLPLSEARTISEGLTHARPQFVAWRAALIAQARRDGGLVRDLFGRERWVHGMNAVDPGARSAAEREVSNFPAQAGLGGIIKGSMRAVQTLYRQAGGSLINQIHDELVGWVPDMSERMREEFAHAVAEAMLWKKLSVPMEVEVGYGRDWSAAKDGVGGTWAVRG